MAKDAHVPLLDDTRLMDIFCFEEKRVLTNDFIVRYENRLFQVTKDQKAIPRPKDKVVVRELLDGTIKLLWQDIALNFTELECRKEK